MEDRSLLSANFVPVGCDQTTDAAGNVMAVLSVAEATGGVDVALAGGVTASGGASFAPNGFDPTQTFLLHSNASADKVIYLDFTGHVTTGTLWNDSNNSSITTPAYDTDGNASSFSISEQQNIFAIFERVAEDYAPFNVDVTTQDPGIERLRNTGRGDTQWGMRAIIGGNGSWFGQSAGGVSYVGVFNRNTDTGCFIFADNLGNGNEKYVAEAVSHEVGHSLGLNHDGTASAGYYQGQGSGETGWAPIMGVGYYQNLSQWSKGEYSGANNGEDDLAIISNLSTNGFGYRTDDAGNTIGTATALGVTGTAVSTYGIIERNTDVDVYSFDTGPGAISLTIKPAARGPNLDISATLYNSAGAVVATSNPVAGLSASFSTILTAGRYYLAIDGVGAGSPSGTGYSDYASLGQYAITGVLVPLAPGPEIQVLDGATNLTDGLSTVPFGSALVGQPASRTFTVKNLGTLPLTLGTLAVSVGFTLTSGFGATTLAPGASTTFTVRLDATTAGNYSGTISFGNNDTDENPFNFAVTGTVVTSLRFDFGTGGSPVSPGYTNVSTGGYSAAAGYGWADGSVQGFDTGVGADLTRDFVYTAQGTFAVDVPNGTYDVKVTLGDLRGYAHEQMGVFLEGVQVDAVTTFAEAVAKTYTVAVTDGQLTLLLKDLGGADPNVMINALEISASGPDVTGARVVSSTPSGSTSGPVDRVAVTFSEAVRDGTFTLADVVSISGPGGAVAPVAVNKLSGTQYEVTFAPQTAPGTYQVVIGPDVLDAAGNPLDQNGNGANGENPADRYTANFTIAAFTPLRFDFGTGGSPVSPGYTNVSTGGYSAAAGYGWADGSVQGFDTGVGADLTRDFVYTAQGTFAVDVPNGTYDVKVTLGDLRGYAHEQMGVFLEGVQVDAVTTFAEAVAKTYTVAVTDGQLTLLLKDLGGADPNVMINALEISASGPDVTGARVVSSTPSGSTSGPVDRVAVTFSEAVRDGTFTLADVVSISGPGGAVAPVAVNKLSGTQYEVTFAPQTAPGTYQVVIGPDVLDAAGNPLDQNGNGANGENPADRYTANFTIAAFTPLRFDFGTGGSPVSPGYTNVSTGGYSAAAGYGWADGSVQGFDTGVGADLTRDFVYTAQGTFAVDVPNGTYDVKVTLGDLRGYAHEQMGVFLEGVQVDAVTTFAEAVAKTYTVAVTDGQLTLLLKDLGGADPNVMINALEIGAHA